jgi:hypothetical protein
MKKIIFCHYSKIKIRNFNRFINDPYFSITYFLYLEVVFITTLNFLIITEKLKLSS